MPSTNVLLVFGTRPEAIKLAPVIRELSHHDDVGYSVCVSAQHRAMLDQVLDLFEIQPDHDLDLMTEAQSPSQVASALLARIGPVLDAERPDLVVVQGDTTTTAAAAMAAYYGRVRVAHVEAGLRTGDRWRPFPEEINRKIAGAIADLHFAPTETARSNLLREGVRDEDIVVTGNTAIDALNQIVGRPRPESISDILKGPERLADRRIILVTTHRRENFGRPLENICAAIRVLASTRSDLRVILPVHPNPEVQTPVVKALSDLDNVKLTDPLDYASLVHVMDAASLILTDSGGIQEEAPALGKPVLVIRDVTERPEGIEAGVAKLVGTDADRIVSEVESLLDDPDEYARMSRAVNPYGDGQASRRIVASLLGQPTDEFAP